MSNLHPELNVLAAETWDAINDVLVDKAITGHYGQTAKIISVPFYLLWSLITYILQAKSSMYVLPFIICSLAIWRLGRGKIESEEYIPHEWRFGIEKHWISVIPGLSAIYAQCTCLFWCYRVVLLFLFRTYLFGVKLYNLGSTGRFVIFQHQSSALIQRCKQKYSDVRQVLLPFRNQFKVHIGNNTHSHPTSAAYRTAVNRKITELITTAGYQPYMVSKAKSDQYSGTRYFYGVKDLQDDYTDDAMPENPVLVFIDVDYYADMSSWLMLGHPIMMYTLAPSRLSAKTREYHFYCDRKTNEIVQHVSGGAEYHHQLWDYKGDVVTVEDAYGSLLIYHIEQRLVNGDEDRRVILFSPMAKISAPVCDLITERRPLRRKDLTGGYLYDAITDTVSLAGKTDPFHSVELPYAVFVSIQSRLRNKTCAPTYGDIERILRDNGVTDVLSKATIVWEHLDTKITQVNVVKTSKLSEQDVNYRPIVDNTLPTENFKFVSNPATPPLVFPGNASPVDSESSDHATIQGRVEKPRNEKRPHYKFDRYANDFVNTLVGRKHKRGIPFTAAEVKLYQTKPMQKQRLAMVELCESGSTYYNRLNCFVKKETYSTANSPRNITTMAPETTLAMSRYAYAFKRDVLMHYNWYYPGMKPVDVCERLKALSKNGVIETDYARFDGSISEWLQQRIVKAAYMRWVSAENQNDCGKWIDAIFARKARTKHGVAFDPGYGTRSGSPITTDGNTMINAFITYTAYREAGVAHAKAFQKLGLFCGDDGYTPVDTDIDISAYLVQAAKTFGLQLEVKVVQQGPYSFCGRRFVDPVRIPDSYQDIKRTLPKLHIVLNGPDTIEQRLANKAHGYSVTDHNTPLIGDWAKRVIALTGLGVKNQTHEEQFKMQYPWPQTDEQALLDAVARDLGITTIELTEMRGKLSGLDDLSRMPTLMIEELAPKIPCIRHGLLDGPEAHETNPKTIVPHQPTTSVPTEQSSNDDTESRGLSGDAQTTAHSQNNSEHANTSARSGFKPQPNRVRPLVSGVARYSQRVDSADRFRPNSETSQTASTSSSSGYETRDPRYQAHRGGHKRPCKGYYRRPNTHKQQR